MKDGGAKGRQGQGLSLKRFASRGSKGAMLSRKKEEMEVRAHKKAAALRKYARLAKQEGITSDRVNVDGVRKTKSEKEAEQQKQKQKNPVHNRFAEAEKEAARSKKAKVEADDARAKVQEEIEKAKMEREAKRREVIKRKHRGLNSSATTLLEKIQARQQQKS
jgi:hypothetical protein